MRLHQYTVTNRFLVSGLLFLSLMVYSSAQAADAFQTHQHHVIIVGSELDYPPYAMVDANGQADGFSVDLIKAVAKETGLELRFRVGPWSQIKDMLEHGEIDALPLVAYSRERDQVFDFTAPHTISYASVFLRKNAKGIHSIHGLRGKEVIVMQSDSSHELVVNNGITDKITLTKSLGDAFLLLAAGKHDFVVAPKLTGLLLLQKLGIDSIEPFGPLLEAYGKGYSFAVRKGNKELLEHLDRGLNLIKANGEYDKIYDKWFGHLEPKPLIPENIRSALIIAGTIAIISLLIFLLWNLSLKKQVATRTRELLYEKKMAQQYLHTLKAMVVALDAEGNITLINEKACEVLGWAEQEAMGKNWFEYFIPESQRDEVRHYFKQIIDADLEALEFVENHIIDKQGNEHLIAWHNSYITDNQGRITGALSSGEDITETRKSENKIKELQDQFHQAQKMEAIGTLVGGVAHDFNNILAGITGNLYLLKQAVKDNGKAVKRVNSIEALSFRAADMIKQLLTFSRKNESSMQALRLSSFLKESVKLYKPSLPENIRINQNINATDLVIKADANQIQQAMLNLINDAKDALEGRSNPEISISLDQFDAPPAFRHKHPSLEGEVFACIRVSDNGQGIQPAAIPHLFEPFFTTKEVGKGTGLGLAMVHGSIESHGGIIEVESTPDSGTTFSIYLPVIEQENAEDTSAAAKEPAHGQQETILLVDDESVITGTGRDVLESLNYQVYTAANGQQAVDLFTAHAHQIDLVILDVVMPIMGGKEAARTMRHIKPDLKVIFSTGYDSTSKPEDMQRKTSDPVIAKPFQASELSHLIRKVLQH